MRLLEVLTRTRFQIFTFSMGNMKAGGYPDGAGSGFMLLHKGKTIFVTADHVCHPFDHKPGVTQRVFMDKEVGLVNNFIKKDEKGVDIPILTPIGEFYYFDQFQFTPDLQFKDFRPFDATFAILGEDRFQNPFLSEPLYVQNGDDVPGGLPMIHIPSETVIQPNPTDRYICYGHTNHRLADDGIHLAWDVSHHEDMVYAGENGDYFVLTPAEPIVKHEWGGISGAPVFNQEGGLLGILCGGIPQYNIIFVMKMHKVLKLIDSTLTIEDLQRNN